MLLTDTPSRHPTIDFTAILKASQSLSRIIHPDDLRRQLTQVMRQTAGADRCTLLLPDAAGAWQVSAVALPPMRTRTATTIDPNSVIQPQVIEQVRASQTAVVIHDGDRDLPIADDCPVQPLPQHILCLPIVNQGDLLGILYLNHRSANEIFTPGRVLILNFLCAQAAVSLNHARQNQHCSHIWDCRDITDRQAAETAIHQKSQELQQALQELQQTQLHMVQSEKMSALGNLVAGVAHEINNPIGCIVGNVGIAQNYINDLLDVLDLYAAQCPEPGAAIATALETIDLAYMREDLPKLMRAMRDGGDRIKAISRSLRTFSRADTAVQQAFNLHEGIDSTVLILRHRLKANSQRPDIQVVTDYGQIPLVKCFPGQINQVFMNIIANAIDALDEANDDRHFTDIEADPPQIAIQTRLEPNQVKIVIRDNGPGMSESVSTQIFDHLFTTKAVGLGTGLGLAIARQIVVEKHGGSLTAQSELGQGTEFIIRLPIDASPD